MFFGDDQPDATMPALTGSRDGDWAAFAAAYYYIPLTAQDLATGHDPDIAKALALLSA